MITKSHLDAIFDSIREAMNMDKGYDFLADRKAQNVTAKWVLYHAIKDEDVRTIAKTMRISRTSVYFYRGKYEDVLTSFAYKKERNLMRKFDKILESKMEEMEKRKELDENDFWNCKYSIYAGECLCKRNGQYSKCLLAINGDTCPYFEEEQ